MRIAILYIGTGRYTVFWKKFYKSCEKFFITDAQKHYFFFTDSKKFKSAENLTIVAQKQLDFAYITTLRYKILNSVREQLKNYDYIFFFNGNMEFVKPVSEAEFLPDENEGIVASLHSMNKRREPEDFPYEKNPKSTSYIEAGKGRYYFHSGILGGRREAALEMFKICEKMADEDLNNGIIPVVHDESIFNKYVLNRTPKILSNYYIFPERNKLWARFIPEVKIIQRDKSKLKYGGHAWLRGETNRRNSLFDYFNQNALRKAFRKICSARPLQDYTQQCRDPLHRV